MPNIITGAATSTGRIRDVNEDAHFLGTSLFLVADGMGGHQAGARASRLVVEHLAGLAHSAPATSAIVEAICAANAAIVADAEGHVDRAGMGTTLVGLCLTELAGSPHWIAFNVGDSRLYRFEGDLLQQVSVDHSEVQELVEAGEITSEQAASHPLRNVITRSLGIEPCPAVDTWMLPLSGPETFLLCSDGLTNELSDPEISLVVRESSSPQAAADQLVALADSAGGRDNATAIIIQIEERTAHATDLAPEPTLPHPLSRSQ